MNSKAPLPSATPRPCRRRGTTGLALLLATGALWVGGPGCSQANDELHATQDALLASLPGEWQTRVQVTVGPLLLGLARAGIAFADVEPEARIALGAVRGFKVSVHEFIGQRADRRKMLAGADKALADRGWERVMGVLEGDELVAVYGPAQESSPRQLPLCVMVFDGHELVLVSARSNVEPLVELALRETRQARGDARHWLGFRAH
jgi:hypothetical protein